MAVIDSHHHVWQVARRPHQWPPEARATLDRDFTPTDLLKEMRAAGVDGTILMQSLNDYEETEEFLDIAQATPWMRGVVGWVPLDNPAETEAALDLLSARGPLVGIRHLMRVGATPGFLQRPDVVQSLTLVARAGLAFETVPTNPEQWEQAFATADRFPDMPCVVNHLGRPPVPESGWEPWATWITRAAARENMVIKLSAGIALIQHWRWSTAQIRPFVEHVIESFGPERVMAGSNWPVVLIAGTYQEVWRGIVELLAPYAESERAAMLGGNAERVYGL
ncbi:MAG TPA: amidohydrolase family protein [Xanthobacteraceae bacterium]|nr:amidohydrolase family protein [Xanthobacteraceae bacterium]